jgi:hypothetical protein
MKKIFLILIIAFQIGTLLAQKASVSSAVNNARKEVVSTMADQSEVKIFPVPVKDNNLNVTSEKEISTIRITNIIGQEVYNKRYPSPVTSSSIPLDNPQRGMYLVTIIFTDNSRAVRKILVEPM